MTIVPDLFVNMSGTDATAPPTPSHSTASYQLASPTSTTALTRSADDQFDVTKSAKTTVAALAGPTYPALTRHPESWLRYLIFYIRDRDVRQTNRTLHTNVDIPCTATHPPRLCARAVCVLCAVCCVLRQYNLWVFTSAFVLLFFAYPIQGVQTIRYPKTGSSTLLILYGFYGITSLFAAPVIDIVGPEWCMPMGALTVRQHSTQSFLISDMPVSFTRSLLLKLHCLDVASTGCGLRPSSPVAMVWCWLVRRLSVGALD